MKLRDSAGGLPWLRSRDEDEEDGPDPRASLRASVDSSVRRLNPRTDWSTLSRSSAKSSVARSLSSPSTAKPVSFDLIACPIACGTSASSRSCSA